MMAFETMKRKGFKGHLNMSFGGYLLGFLSFIFTIISFILGFIIIYIIRKKYRDINEDYWMEATFIGSILAFFGTSIINFVISGMSTSQSTLYIEDRVLFTETHTKVEKVKKYMDGIKDKKNN